MGLEFPQVAADLIFNDKTYPIGLRYKGNSTYLMTTAPLKKSFKIDFSPSAKKLKTEKSKEENKYSDLKRYYDFLIITEYA